MMDKKTNKTKVDTRVLTLIALGMTLNVVGAFIALQLRLPIYMDSLGTLLIACLLGPKYAVITGLSGSLVSGITFDIYSLCFAPVQMSTGYLAGKMYEKGKLKGKKTPLGILAFVLPTALIGATISAIVFGGITSSGSSYLVQILNMLQVPEVMSVFIVQLGTDYADKYLAVILVAMGVKILPQSMKYHHLGGSR